MTVTDPNGKREQVMLRPAGPGRADASLPAAAPGVWRVSDGKRAGLCRRGDDQPARVRRSAGDRDAGCATSSPPRAAASTGSTPPAHRRCGAWARQADTAGAGWIGLRRNDDHVVTGISAIPLLPPWAALPLLLGLVVGAWRREGR